MLTGTDALAAGMALKSYRLTPEFGGRWMVFEDFGGAAFGLGTAYDHLRPMAHTQGEF